MKSTLTIKVLLADDHEIFRDGLQLMLRKEPGILVVGEARNGRELIEMTSLYKPDVILTDIVMSEMDGIEATRKITAAYPDIGIIALTMFNEEGLVIDMLEAGAIGYLLKNADKHEILGAIRSANMLVPYYCKATSIKIAQHASKSRFNTRGPRVTFTEKEKEIISFICEEFTNREIGKRMFLSKRTVDGYRSKILDKMQVKSTAGIVIYALRNSLYQLEAPNS